MEKLEKEKEKEMVEQNSQFSEELEITCQHFTLEVIGGHKFYYDHIKSQWHRYIDGVWQKEPNIKTRVDMTKLNILNEGKINSRFTFFKDINTNRCRITQWTHGSADNLNSNVFWMNMPVTFEII